jgi:hypothetical protein
MSSRTKEMEMQEIEKCKFSCTKKNCKMKGRRRREAIAKNEVACGWFKPKNSSFQLKNA